MPMTFTERACRSGRYGEMFTANSGIPAGSGTATLSIFDKNSAFKPRFDFLGLNYHKAIVK